MPTLIVQSADGSTSRDYPLRKTLTSIGSGRTNDIVLDDPSVEASHAMIQLDGGVFEIQTVSRKCEVRINGKKKRKLKLSHDDEVQIGDVVLRFSIFDGAPAAGLAEESVTGEEIEGYRKLHEFSQKLLSDYELPVLLENLLDAVVSITSADKGFLILLEDEEFRIKVARNVDRENIEGAVEQVSDSIIRKVIESKEPLIVSDALSNSEFNSSQSVINLNLSSVMCVPLLDRGQLLGVLYVGNENIANLFEQRHLDLLTVFASQASLIIANAIMVRGLKLDKQLLSERLSEMRFGSIIGACDAMKEIFRTVEKVAPTTVNVLVTGETGTGKELIAHEIHQRSPRVKGPFVTINCGAIPENLLESELFGHVKGAFTGANQTREGKFQAADGGTIFLDEIGEMPLNLQVKLLRVLQEHTVTKVGATKSEKIDIRVVAATNKNLEKAVREGDFREDLFYRLNVVLLKLPPLRDRGNDVVLIAKYLINEISDEIGVGHKELSKEAIQALRKYAWPGNIRQLENRLKKAIVLADGSVLTPEDLDLPPEVLEPIMPLSEAKERFALRYVMEALERNDGNRTQTARELDVDPRTIFRYLEKETPEA
ncbi:GAF domain-containing protein [Persicimonas caeni]|uniref:GAF domain-containing protein n=1 Tax=Persicimonas caeni TaxID=2292766 RepID=A0A4Y6Q229_PERCE|nr:sigma 54-interacting transcriptional regulator [Persicimonas caeni]QDG54592.1 GAF domain-containing protein [Persicimonas caeni]QED35813.1 GAF domain-containing protein [Persicimonas caeni]